MPKTVASAALNAFVQMSDIDDLAATLGLHPSNNGTGLQDTFREELAPVLTLIADAYHGDRNKCFAVGDRHATAELPFSDIDMKGAYPVAQAYFRPVDWSNVEYTTDVDDLTILDRMTFATVAFQFPAGVRFPSLSCDGGGYGLVYPHSGTTTATGAELFVARSQGATFKVHAGVRLNWRDAAAERPFVAFAATTSTIRARHPQGLATGKAGENRRQCRLRQDLARHSRSAMAAKTPETVRLPHRRIQGPRTLKDQFAACRRLHGWPGPGTVVGNPVGASRSCVGDHRRNRRSVVRCGG